MGIPTIERLLMIFLWTHIEPVGTHFEPPSLSPWSPVFSYYQIIITVRIQVLSRPLGSDTRKLTLLLPSGFYAS